MTDQEVAALYVEGGYEAQVAQRTERTDWSGRLVTFAVMLQVRESGATVWTTVERVDSSRSHRAVHVDQFNQDGAKVVNEDIVPAECRTDLDAAFKWATNYIWDLDGRWQRWRGATG